MDEQQNIIIYRTADGRASVALFAKDGKIWLNQQQMAELFATSKQTISHHIVNILKEKELNEFSVVKQYLTTAADGKNYNVVFYSLEMIIAVGYRVRGLRGTQFRQWATEHLTEYLVNNRILKVVRIMAHVEGREIVQSQHIVGTIGYRNLDRTTGLRGV